MNHICDVDWHFDIIGPELSVAKSARDSHKIYDYTIPSYVVLEKSIQMAMPQTFKATFIFPPSDLPITNFLARQLSC